MSNLTKYTDTAFNFLADMLYMAFPCKMAVNVDSLNYCIPTAFSKPAAKYVGDALH